MRNNWLVPVFALFFVGCATNLSGTGKIVSDTICDWELHGGGVTPDSTAMYCWAEKRFQKDSQWIYQSMPVDCEVAMACSLFLDPYKNPQKQRDKHGRQ